MITGIGIVFHSCTKDDANLIDNRTSTLEMRDDEVNVFSPDDSIKETILGAKVPCNPYTVEIVTTAWNNLYPDNTVNTVPATDFYVKFKPSSEEQVYELYKDPDLTLWDFPLDRKVIQMGDYYVQPGKGENDIPDLYSVVDKDYPLASKGVAYEQLAELVDVPYNTFLSAETFRLCDLTHKPIREIVDSIPRPDTVDPYIPDPPPSDPPQIDCNPDCPNYPCCFLDIVDCDGELDPFEQEMCNNYEPACYPDDPDWPQCLYPDDDDDENINSCGCPTFNNLRKPAGCVRVQSPTGGGYVGVNNAKVIIKNHPSYNYNQNDIFGLFWTETAFTNGNGCWKIDRACEGKIWVWVQFKNEKAYIRGHQGSNLRRFFNPVTDYVGRVSGPNFSNIQVNYNRWDIAGPGTQTQRYWCAATTINAVDDMHHMCNDEGINEPPHLDIYLAEDETGAAWMAHYGGVNNNIYAQVLNSIYWPLALDNIIASEFFLPDIFLDRNEMPGDFPGTAFHEMSHASHFTNVGSGWWQHLTKFEYEHEGHGGPTDNTDTDAGYCAVAESWADHLGVLFDEGNKVPSRRNERFVNESNGWIPGGIHYDLFDSGMGLEPSWPNGGGIIDNVSGFTNAMIFDVLDANTIEIEHIRTRLWNEYSSAPGVNATQTDYLSLFNEYGY